MSAPAWPFPEEIVSPLPTLVVDTLTDCILSANALTEALFGSGAVTGMRLSRFIAPNFPALAVFADEVFHRGSAWTRALKLRRGDESETPCEIRGQVLQSDPPRLMLTFIDLAEQDLHARIACDEELTKGGLLEWARASAFFSELERRNRLILDAAGEGIYGLNAEGKTTFVNRAAQEILGWTSEDLIESDMHSMIHHHHTNGEVYPAQNCPIYQAFRFEKVHRIENEVFWRKDGNPISVEYVSTPIYDRGVLAGAVVIFRDITERKESQTKLRRAMAEIAELRDRLEQENAYLREEILEERAHHDIVGTSVPVRHMISRLELAAQLISTVLITGEPGTGKSLLAAAIHKDSQRRRRPFVQLKCSTVSAESMEVELFGQTRGAFSGVLRDKPGKLELAHGGILYLDAVDALPLDMQGRLVEALETREVLRLGDMRARRIDVRVIASTSKSLEREVAAGQFREDLYFLLNVQSIHCAPLRDRPEDIAPLALHFLRLTCARLNKPKPIVTERTLHELKRYRWPGNVRELANVIERGVILSKDGKLIVEIARRHLGGSIGRETVLTEAELDDLARANLINCLKETRGKVSGTDGAASLLGVRPTTLYSRLKRHRITSKDYE